MSRRTRLAASATIACLVGGALVVGSVPAANAAEEISIESSKVLELGFDGALTDSSPRGAAVGLQKGSAAYAAGIR
ncbi:MAG: hypothetical protein WAK00_06050, partial [Microbacterium sp.]|uniref:hypothetical protein n=1 Tax=Microbacterium sp. TaxID=51671 RepID=UPI003BB10732